MKNVNLYNILVNNGYKLPKQWENLIEAILMDASLMNTRRDINEFIQNNIEMTDDIKEKLVLYGDNQWSKLIFRLQQNGHYKS